MCARAELGFFFRALLEWRLYVDRLSAQTTRLRRRHEQSQWASPHKRPVKSFTHASVLSNPIGTGPSDRAFHQESPAGKIGTAYPRRDVQMGSVVGPVEGRSGLRHCHNGCGALLCKQVTCQSRTHLGRTTPHMLR